MAYPSAPPGLSTLTVAGSARQMGQQQGEHWRDAIPDLCEARLAGTLAWAAENQRPLTREDFLAGLTDFCTAQAGYAPAVHEEFLGIAEGAGVAPELLMAGNGYTDIRDWVVQRSGLDECTTFTALPEATADGGLLCGQTWDMSRSMLPFVYLLRREPADGPVTLTVTTTGCLSLIGLNEAGVAIGNSNITPRDARPGVMYLAMIHHALAQRSLAAAVEAITSAPRASGHHYYLADGETARHVETTATRWVELPRDGVCHTQSNDYRGAGLGDLPQPPRPGGRSVERRCALAEGLAARGPLDAAGCQAALEDGQVRVVDPDSDSITCAAAVMRPGSGELWAAHGAPAAGQWQAHRL